MGLKVGGLRARLTSGLGARRGSPERTARGLLGGARFLQGHCANQGFSRGWCRAGRGMCGRYGADAELAVVVEVGLCCCPRGVTPWLSLGCLVAGSAVGAGRARCSQGLDALAVLTRSQMPRHPPQVWHHRWVQPPAHSVGLCSPLIPVALQG